MTTEHLIPIIGCWVRSSAFENQLGQVVEHKIEAECVDVRVNWGKSGHHWHEPSDLKAGFLHGWSVQDVPVSATRHPLGLGRVIGQRELGKREQLLVQLDETGRSLWLPYENLRRVKDVKLRYERRELGTIDHAERFRVKLLAHALENWNYMTGSLDRLDVDPLPHQIHLVHRILSSGNYNWLIADDVGLGKTIEVGLVLAALKRKGFARRVLVVCPAGLTRQWQDEMQFKFNETYEIYGRDFIVNNPLHWKLHDHVIVSIDLAKREDHLQAFRAAGGWNVVVFDEGHKLTRYETGERAQRYRLAETLRPLADAFLLLSGTPHQGYPDRFVALLELVRPDRSQELHSLEVNPEIVNDMILRNRKSEVTDAAGEFVFKGHIVSRVPVEPSAEMRTFQRLLNRYLQQGYKAGESRGAAGRAIGFVMTTYRKLASSSIAAIERALLLRRERLRGEAVELIDDNLGSEVTLEDLVDGGDDQDVLADTVPGDNVGEFFAYEQDMIDNLLEHAKAVRANDDKLDIFLGEVVSSLVSEDKKLLIFTEYRATQTYLKDAIENALPAEKEVLLINGSMKLDEKLETIHQFNAGDNRFLISTEAGGEGLNLHRSCHIMVNYDLPWNPARLVQRIGRLYRYGQTETVVVINLHARDSFDNTAIDLMLTRVDQIVRDMAPVGEEFNDRLYAEILGDVLDRLDFSSVLHSATSMVLDRTKEEIEKALGRAHSAKRLQDDIFSQVSGYDPSTLEGKIGFTMDHVNLFVRHILPILGISIEDEFYSGEVLQIRLPNSLRGVFTEFQKRLVVRVTTNRRRAESLRDVVLLDFESEFFTHLIAEAKSQEFDGIYTALQMPHGREGALAVFKLRWQNDQGDPVAEDLVTVFRNLDGRIVTNPSFLYELLTGNLMAASIPEEPAETRRQRFEKLIDRANLQLGIESTRFKHPNGIVQLAAADCRTARS